MISGLSVLTAFPVLSRKLSAVFALKIFTISESNLFLRLTVENLSNPENSIIALSGPGEDAFYGSD